MAARYADLHTHSLYSDGRESPSALMQMARAAGLDAIALTDHDSIEGIAEAAAAAQTVDVELIPGIELSCTDGSHDIHLLAYWIDVQHPALLATLQAQQDSRRQRLDAIIARLAQHGVTISRDDILQMARGVSVGRPHVARALVARGAVSTVDEAFVRYLGDRAPCYVPSTALSSAEAIALIRQVGGVPVLAHPLYLRDDTVIERLCDQGLVGLEAYHGSHTTTMAQRYEQIATRLGLLVTGGSDYHGAPKDEGTPLGAVKLPYQHVEALRTWRAQHTSVS